MSAEQVIFINILLYFGGFAFFLWQRNNLSEQSIAWLSIAINLIGTLFSLGIHLSETSSETIHYPWFTIGKYVISFDLLINDLTFLLYFLVQFIALLVQIYSMEYMKGDALFGKYYALLNLFIFSMLGVVVAGNLLVMYFFWELVGLSSYSLIGFWYYRIEAASAGKKAFIVNRIGDIGFLLGIFLVFQHTHSFSFESIAQINPQSNSAELTTIGLLLFCGCIGKSAQFPLQIWLPDAMEGPTPVSALIHAATMVAAGVFMMARISPLLTDTACLVITIVGTLTMFMGAYSAITQYDIKKVLAYSTISQLGLMVMGIGVKAVNASLFHLTTHAFFKAGLFLCAGAVIHAVHEQDMRKIGGLRKEMPLVFTCYAICAASLAGLPFFSGHLSKDTLLVAAFAWAEQHHSPYYSIVPYTVLLTSGMTSFYMMRQLYLIFIGQEHLNPLKIASTGVVSFSKTIARRLEAIVKVEDGQEDDLAPHVISQHLRKFTNIDFIILILAFASFGFIFSKNPFSAEESWFLADFPAPSHSFYWIPYAAVGASVVGLLLGYVFSEAEAQSNGTQPLHFFAKLSLNHFYLDKFYTLAIIQPIVWTSRKLQIFDKNVIDGFVNFVAQVQVFLARIIHWVDTHLVDYLVNLLATISGRIGNYTRQFQNGQAQSYIIILFLGVVLVIAFLMI